jgi:hypothetical protein
MRGKVYSPPYLKELCCCEKRCGIEPSIVFCIVFLLGSKYDGFAFAALDGFTGSFFGCSTGGSPTNFKFALGNYC